MKTISRPTPDQLADALERMVIRYGVAVGEQARADGSHAAIRWTRARHRRFIALQRLTEALRKQADA